jgi:cell wall-associated NlpC family hydrolase
VDKEIVEPVDTKALVQAAKEEAVKKEEEYFTSLVIADVNDYVNVRDLPSETDGEIVGKLYDNSVGHFIEEENGWYKITSGNCTGYVKGEYCVTGEDAIALAKEVGVRIATVNTTTLKVREEASQESSVLGLVPMADELVVTEELDGWVKVDIEEGFGYVSTDYVELSTEFVEAESKEEEEARLEKERRAREEANAAAARTQASRGGTAYRPADPVTQVSGSGTGVDVANYALQFVGNPYVYGGTSLTNGTDCSGFVMRVYENFGVSLPRTSASQRGSGYDVGSIDNAIPGDIVCYSGHVAIYIGNGQIVHASTAKTGIIVSNATYRQPLCVRRIF